MMKDKGEKLRELCYGLRIDSGKIIHYPEQEPGDAKHDTWVLFFIIFIFCFVVCLYLHASLVFIGVH